MAEQNDQRKQWSRIVAKAWADENFKARLKAEPGIVLAEEGIKLDDDMNYTVVEELEKQIVLVLPHKPAPGNNVEYGEMRRAAFIFK